MNTKFVELCIQILVDMLVFMAMYSLLAMVATGFWLLVLYMFCAVLYIAWSISKQRARARSRVEAELDKLFKELGEPGVTVEDIQVERNTQITLELDPRKWGWVKRITASA